MIALGVHTAVLLILAGAAWCVTHRLRGPELGHVLWLLVFLKLLIPPVVDVPIFPAATQPDPVRTTAPVMTDTIASARGSGHVLDEPLVHDRLGAATPIEFATSSLPADTANDVPYVQSATPTIDPRLALVLVWLIGVAACLLVNAIRVARFGTLLEHAQPAPDELACRVRTLARRIGLTETPPVFVLDAAISPAIWTGMRSRLVLPRRLLGRLDDRELDSVILHELAHWARGDHWVRALECVVMTLYWWLPPVWWMQRELRATEELCCDARVVLALRGEPRSYADALIKTVTFLSGPGARPLPGTATGAGPTRPLTRRLTMIMQTRPARPWTRRSRIALVLAGLVTLPLMPTRAQDAPLPTDRAPEATGLPAPTDMLPRVAVPADRDRQIARVLEAMMAAVEARQEARMLGDLTLAGEFGAVLESLKHELDTLWGHGGVPTAPLPGFRTDLDGRSGGFASSPLSAPDVGGRFGAPRATPPIGIGGGGGGGLGAPRPMVDREPVEPRRDVRDGRRRAPSTGLGGGVGRTNAPGATGGSGRGSAPGATAGAGGRGGPGRGDTGGRRARGAGVSDSAATIETLQAQVTALAEQTAKLQQQLLELMRQQQEADREN